jgi:hypothetical protein
MPEVGPRLADCSPETRLFLPIQFHLPEKSHYQVLLERFHLSSFGVYQDFTEESSVQTPAVSELSRVNAAFRNSGDTEALS